MRPWTPLVALVAALALVLGIRAPAAWAATTWVVHLASSAGMARTQGLPPAPTAVAAACTAPITSTTIKVTWSSVTHATAYSVYESTNYWFEVLVNTGSNWASAKSSATGESTIHSSSPFCDQP